MNYFATWLGLSLILFFAFIPIFFIWVIVGVSNANKKKDSLQATQYKSFNKQQFNKDFSFICEYCGSSISTKDEICPVCGGSYGKNKEYKETRKKVNTTYLVYLENQKKLIIDEMKYIEDTVKILKKNILMKNTFYNFDLGEKPKYVASDNFEFVCDYCDTKLKGHSKDGQNCTRCGASYENNLDLLTKEKESELEKLHYEEYVKLKDIELMQNEENYRKDTKINKHGGTIALIVLSCPFIIAAIITLILKCIY